MRTKSVLFALLLIAAFPLFGRINTLDNVPSATLLLPHFDVSATDTTQRTVVTIGNTSGTEVVAHVVLWTDRGVTTLNFDIRLGPRDVEEIDLQALFATGALPQTTPGSVPGCGAFLPPPSIPPATLAGVQAAHSGGSSSLFGGSCAGVNHGDGRMRGFITIDVAGSCSNTFPDSPGYFVAGGTGIATNANVLWGEYVTFSGNNNIAHGDVLVAIEASAVDPATDGAPGPPAGVEDYTFYRRKTGSAADNRESLVSRWMGKYDNAGLAQTTALVWRDPGDIDAFPCGAPPAGLGIGEIVAFDEQEQPAQACPPPAATSMPNATQAVNLESTSQISIPFTAGFIQYDLRRATPSGVLGTRNQAFISHVRRVATGTTQLTAWPLTSITGFGLFGAFCPECADGVDNDGDGLIDSGSDPGCRNSPRGVERPECSDGIDNDLDGQIDHPNDPHCWGPFDRLEFDFGTPDNPQCDDGSDNDGDGLIDWPNDPHCSSHTDNSEAAGVCSDGIDNDGDGLTDLNDPDCTGPTDSSEASTQCRDGLDNDGDGLIDFGSDPGCASVNSTTESPQCNDNISNDADGLVDMADPGCAAPSSNTESPQCNDGIDNDGDTFVDFPADRGCTSASDSSEPPFNTACSDGIDNDGDGLIDFPLETSCVSPSDTSEAPECSDGVDNDGDGVTDFPGDPGCASAADLNECAGTTTRQCSDGVDNDGDGRIDFPGDPGCESRGDDVEFSIAAQQNEPVGAPALSPLGMVIAALLLAMAGFIALRGGMMNG